MPQSHIKTVRDWLEQDSGELQGIEQLKLLEQGYDPLITPGFLANRDA